MLDLTKMDPFVVKILKEHGWYEGRNFDISDWLKALSNDGYESFEYAESILRSFGGISINVDGDENHMGAQFDFNAIYAVGRLEQLKMCEVIANEPLFPLGEMVQASAYVGRSKKIYFGYWREFFLIGNSIEDYLNNLFDLNMKSRLLCSNPRSEDSKEELEELFEKVKE